jgi:hypothetical protein
MMDDQNLRDIWEAVTAWQRVTLELRAYLAEIYHAEGYHLVEDRVIGEAVVLRCLNTFLDQTQDTTAAFVLALLREQAKATDGWISRKPT